MNFPYLVSNDGDKTVVVEGTFKAPISRVYRAWTEADELMQWFCPEPGILLNVNADVRVGGRLCFEFKTEENLRSAIEARYKEIKTDERLVFSWSHVVVDQDGNETATPESLVTVTFTAVNDTTNVRLEHEGIQTEGGRQGVSSGWDGTFARFAAFVDASEAA